MRRWRFVEKGEARNITCLGRDLIGIRGMIARGSVVKESVEPLVLSGGGNEVLGGRRRLRHRASHGAPRGAGRDARAILCIKCRSSILRCTLQPRIPYKTNIPTHQVQKLCLREPRPRKFSLANLHVPRLASSGIFTVQQACG